MNTGGESYVSLFDLIEEESSCPCKFGWSQPENCKEPSADPLYQGELQFSTPAGPFPRKSRMFALFSDRLVRYKVGPERLYLGG